ncbi:MAG: 3-beta hydroxysteroid dehydrogenase [Rhodoglobus sp.]|nr:3-beta hydroxysteroid dehydrogenase [Rhodoglobus sp.]
MKVFVTGASGWIGSALVPELIAAGHHVVGLARSDASAAKVTAMGAEVLRGDTDDLELLRAAAADSDGVVNLAFKHDFDDFVSAGRDEARTVETLAAALEGSGKPLVVASGTPAVAGRVATENDEPAPVGPGAIRAGGPRTARDYATRGVRSSVVRLPRSVHGEGDAHGFISRMIAGACEKGVSGYVGDGAQRWPAVHVLDAAHLFRLALESAPAGSVLHAVGDEGVLTADITAAIGTRLGMPTASVTAEDFGFLGMVLSFDQPASSTITRELLGWEPVQPGLIADIEAGHYFD